MAFGETISKEETNCLRITNFILTVARDVVRKRFDLLYPPSTLETTVQSNWTKIEELQQRKLITSKQVALLFTQKGEVSASLDIKTMVVLMTCLTHNCSFELPEGADTTLDADLLRLRWYRTEITYISEVTMEKFETRWYSISQAVLRLGGERYTDVCNQLKTAPLHASDS
ncbi:uncharacterized protein LOC134727679 [Mytilus trossulus]|uniref:uncharacterized protein LOC134727679 n=1 Tax=Mytilus trossulus TaxID=6551 RepID=UPI0030052607